MAPSEASAKGWRLTSVSCGSWSEWIVSMTPVAQRLDHAPCRSSSRAQRRRQLEEGAVAADVVLVQREVVDRDAGARGLHAFWRAATSARARRRSRRICAAWYLTPVSIPPAAGRAPAGWSRLRRGMPLRPSTVAKAPRSSPRRRKRGSCRRAWWTTRHAEIGGVAHGRTQQGASTGWRTVAIGEADGAGLLEQAELGHLLRRRGRLVMAAAAIR
jgi:hypothetical protein